MGETKSIALNINQLHIQNSEQNDKIQQLNIKIDEVNKNAAETIKLIEEKNKNNELLLKENELLLNKLHEISKPSILSHIYDGFSVGATFGVAAGGVSGGPMGGSAGALLGAGLGAAGGAIYHYKPDIIAAFVEEYNATMERRRRVDDLFSNQGARQDLLFINDDVESYQPSWPNSVPFPMIDSLMEHNSIANRFLDEERFDNFLPVDKLSSAIDLITGDYISAIQGMNESTFQFYGSLESGARRVLGGVLSGEINSLDDLWSATTLSFEGMWDRTLDRMLDGFLNWGSSLISDFGGDILGGFGEGLFGLDLGIFGQSQKNNNPLGNLTSSLFSTAAGKGMDWLGGSLGGGTFINDILSGITGGANFGAIQADFAGISSEIGGMGGEAANEGLSSLLAGGLALGPATLFGGAALGVIGGGMLLGELTKDPMTPEEALEVINDNLEILSQRFAAAGGEGLELFSDLAVQMERVADRAGIGAEGLDRMVDALGPAQAKLVEAAEAAGLAGDKIDEMVDAVQRDAEMLPPTTSQAQALSDMLRNLADSMNLPEAASAELRQAIDELVSSWELGLTTSDTLAQLLNREFAEALSSAAGQADGTVEQMRSLARAIESIPTQWSSDISVTRLERTIHQDLYQGTDIYHTGGVVGHAAPWRSARRFHAGALVTTLAEDEVPIIARRGEYVVRAESVNAATLPMLAALNQTGRAQPAAAGPALVINAPLINIEGSLIASEAQKDELARELERRLADLAASRFMA